MKKLIFLILCILCMGGVFFLKKSPSPQIYDCFLFFNELELLEIRLREMYAHVDKFVLVESTETFRGTPKPLYFAENRALFEQFSDKIIYIPLKTHYETNHPWKREAFQRQQIMQGLSHCRSNDVIFLSDLDEIVRGERIKELAHLITSKELQAIICIQKMYTGYLNRFASEWSGTVITSFRKFKSFSVEKIRNLRMAKARTLKKTKISKLRKIDNTGWHFNSMGGFKRYALKLASFSHYELDTPQIDKARLYEDLVASLPRVEIDLSFPAYIFENQAYFEKIGLIEPAAK